MKTFKASILFLLLISGLSCCSKDTIDSETVKISLAKLPESSIDIYAIENTNVSIYTIKPAQYEHKFKLNTGNYLIKIGYSSAGFQVVQGKTTLIRWNESGEISVSYD